jgi:ubiquinone/menaquinone biosynthesis C-methylase UbiE
MDRFDAHYVHGTDPDEQGRLSRLNSLLNPASLEALGLRGGERVLDIGSGLGQFSRLMARTVGEHGTVVGIERDERQLAESRRLAEADGEADLVDLRQGDAVDLPLADDEWGRFDVAHARFLLEHVTDPPAVVRSMVRAVRPGGRIVLEDDDHEVLRMWPAAPAVLDAWRAYYRTYERQGKDPYVGRHLVSLLHEAGARPRSNRCLFFGTCAGSGGFETMLDNFLGVIEGARQEIVAHGLASEERFDEALEQFARWRTLPDAALWYTTAWAEGRRPAG